MITPRWLTRFLDWKPLESGVFRLNKVKEGETIVIGGLIKTRKSNTDTGTKGLMNIPIIGQFFKLNEKESSKSELVIFLTPRIVYGDTN